MSGNTTITPAQNLSRCPLDDRDFYLFRVFRTRIVPSDALIVTKTPPFFCSISMRFFFNAFDMVSASFGKPKWAKALPTNRTMGECSLRSNGCFPAASQASAATVQENNAALRQSAGFFFPHFSTERYASGLLIQRARDVCLVVTLEVILVGV